MYLTLNICDTMAINNNPQTDKTIKKKENSRIKIKRGRLMEGKK